MDPPVLFGLAFVIAGTLVLIAELHSLTVYLLALAIGLFAASALSFAGVGLDAALVVLAVIVVLGMPLAHFARKRLKNRESERVSQDDVGHEVVVVSVEETSVRVAYRGSTWSARFDTPATLASARTGDRYRIVRRDGNTLVLGAPVPPPARVLPAGDAP